MNVAAHRKLPSQAGYLTSITKPTENYFTEPSPLMAGNVRKKSHSKPEIKMK
jgi:hypothetical protein